MAIPPVNEILQWLVSASQTPANQPLFYFSGIILLFCFSYAIYWFTLYFLNKRTSFFLMEVQFPHVSEEEVPEQIERMKTVFASLQGFILSNTNKLSFEIYKVDSYITMQIGSNSKIILERVASSLTQIRNIIVKETTEDALTNILPLYCKTVTNVKDFYPITQDEHFFDNLLVFLNSLPEGETAGVQFILRGVNKNEEMQRRRRELEHRAVKAKRRQTDRETYLFNLYQKKQEGNLFKVKMNIVANKRHYLSNLLAQLKILNFEENIFYRRGETKTNVITRFISPDTYFSNIHFRRKHEGSYMNNRELAYLIHPTAVSLGSYNAKQTNDIEAKPEFLTDQENNILIGTTQNQKGDSQNLYFPLQNFARHIYAIGKTGSGKSSLLVTMIKTLMQKKDTTIFVFDPHGDLLKDTLNVIQRSENVVYLNIHNTDRIFTINPLFAFRKSTTQKAVLKDKLLDIIRNETEELSGGATTGNATHNRMRQVLDILLEFADAYYDFLTKTKGISEKKAEQLVYERQLTLNDMPYLLEKSYDYASLLERVFKESKTPAGQYIRKLMADHMRQPAVNEAMQVRMSQLIHASTRLVYEGNSLDIENLMDSGKTFLFPIPDSVFGGRGSRGLLQIIFSLLWVNKQEVAKKEQRKDTYVVIDEFQNAQLEDIPKILSEARKYKLYLMASNQYLGQLKERIQHALFGNVGTLISFNVGAGINGAKTVSENLGDSVTERDLTMLSSYRAYLKTKVPNIDSSVVFSLTTIPVEDEETSENTIEKINTKSLNEYGELKSVLEDKLARKQESPIQYFLEGI